MVMLFDQLAQILGFSKKTNYGVASIQTNKQFSNLSVEDVQKIRANDAKVEPLINYTPLAPIVAVKNFTNPDYEFTPTEDEDIEELVYEPDNLEITDDNEEYNEDDNEEYNEEQLGDVEEINPDAEYEDSDIYDEENNSESAPLEEINPYATDTAPREIVQTVLPTGEIFTTTQKTDTSGRFENGRQVRIRGTNSPYDGMVGTIVAKIGVIGNETYDVHLGNEGVHRFGPSEFDVL